VPDVDTLPPPLEVPWNRQSATSSAVSPVRTTLRVVSWIVGFIADDALIYIPGAKTRIPAAPVTCERICGST
jgi:hypothetical protein